MALGGGYGDLYIRQYSDMIEHELQQKGSVLRGLVTIEQAMGERHYFAKIGAASSYEVTGRNQDIDLEDQTNERRFVSPRVIEAAKQIDKIDLVRYQRSPQPELVESMAMKLGREMDANILTAMEGAAARELDGSTSNASFDTSNNQIAVNFNTYAATTMSGDTGLHEGKIAKAIEILQSNYSLAQGDEIFVVAPAKQLSGLRSRIFASNAAGWFQKNLPDLHVPNLDSSLDGFMGCRFIQYENTGVDGSSDQKVFVLLRKAVKMAVYEDIQFSVTERPAKKGTPTLMKAGMVIGSVRMWEEGVVRILCDPTPLYA